MGVNMGQEIRLQRDILLLSWLLAIILILVSMDLLLFAAFDRLNKSFLIYAGIILFILLCIAVALFVFMVKHDTIKIDKIGIIFNQQFKPEKVCWEEFKDLEIKMFLSRTTLVKVVLYLDQTNTQWFLIFIDDMREGIFIDADKQALRVDVTF